MFELNMIHPDHLEKELSLELPLPTDILADEIRAFGIEKTLNQIQRNEFALWPLNELGEHFAKLIQSDDSLQAIAAASREFEVLDGDSRQALVDLIKADRFRDLDHMADYLQYGPDSLYGMICMDYNGKSIVLPAPLRVLYDRFGTEKSMGEIRLAEAELAPVSEMGRQLIAAFQPYSDTIATANVACQFAQTPDLRAGAESILGAARNVRTPMPTETLRFYCPLSVQFYDDECEDIIDVGNNFLVWHEKEVRAALHAEISEGENMAQYLDPPLQDKVASAEWDIAVIDGVAYGKITCELAEPLDMDEQADLADWIRNQNSDGLGEGFEQRPVLTDDGELYVHLWEHGDGYYVLPEDEFRAQKLCEQAQGFGGMGGMA